MSVRETKSMSEGKYLGKTDVGNFIQSLRKRQVTFRVSTHLTVHKKSRKQFSTPVLRSGSVLTSYLAN